MHFNKIISKNNDEKYQFQDIFVLFALYLIEIFNRQELIENFKRFYFFNKTQLLNNGCGQIKGKK